MLCAISGEPPQEPVANKNTGTVFEKRLITTHITQHGTDPTTNEPLSTDDLIDLQSSRIVRPRPPQLTSIPSLLSVFQNEWDALALESFKLQQQLQQTRQELSTALYQNDAAVRVIARLTEERDEARAALAQVGVTGVRADDEDAMAVESTGLSEELQATVEATQTKLSKTRRKRAVPEDWADEEDIQKFTPIAIDAAPVPGAQTFSLDATGDLVLLGGQNGRAEAYSIDGEKPIHVFEGDGGAVTDVLWSGVRAVVASSTGAVRIYDDGSEISKFEQHAGAATAIAAHPSGNILASVGVDKRIFFYDVLNSTVASSIFASCALTTAAFHPDGHLFAAGGIDGQIKIYDVKTGSSAAEFDTNGRIQSLAFSENGIWLASVSKGESSITIWDLRKMSQVKTLEAGSPVSSVRWDYTGQYLAAAALSGVTVFKYSKSSKDWSEPLDKAVPGVGVEWGQNAKSLIVLSPKGELARLA